MRFRIRRQEFPYDIGILENMKQGMGGTPLLWLWPFTGTPSNKSGLEFKTNGFEGTACSEWSIRANMLLTDPSSSWPPPDPERMPRSTNRLPLQQAFIYDEDLSTDQNKVDAFRRRQQEDLKRYNETPATSTQRRPLHNRLSDEDDRDESFVFKSNGFNDFGSGHESWRDSEGDRLNDFGVDEDAEFYDEDDIPLAELLRRRREPTNF